MPSAKTEQMEMVHHLARQLEGKLDGIRAHFSHLPDYAIDDLIVYYLRTRISAESHPEFYERKAIERITQFRPDAEKAFWEIQQKKLFNAQCLWRADKVKLKGISVTLDFNYWEDRIENCPAIPPVTQAEVDLYVRYLRSPDCNAGQFRKYFNYQGYDQWKRDDQSETKNDGLPRWFEFYDTYMGTGSMLRLPDVRFELEMYYFHYQNRFHKKVAETKKQQAQENPLSHPTPPPTIHQYPNVQNKNLHLMVAEAFEEPEILNLFREWVATSDDRYLAAEKEDMNTVIDLILRNADRPVPIKAHYNFREAVIRAAFNYKHERMAEHMQSVYEDYLFRMETGIGYEMKPPLTPAEENHHYIQHILDGRQLAGETRDLNF